MIALEEENVPSRKLLFSSLEEPQHRGQATEAIIKAEFVLRNFPVLEPSYDNEPYDFVVEHRNRFYRFQAKTGRKRSTGTIQFETVSTKARSDGYVRDDYIGEIDYFVVYAPFLESIYLVHIDQAATGKMELRYKRPGNNQSAGVNWHEEYLFDRVIERGLRKAT